MIVVPDIHGSLRLLEFARGIAGDKPMLFLGDLLDRGSENRLVIAGVRTLVESGQAILLLGNHEEMAIQGGLFKHRDDQINWLRNGGEKVLEEYYLHFESPQEFREVLEQDLMWLSRHARDLHTEEGILFAHAMPPARTLSGEVLLKVGGVSPHLWNRPLWDTLDAPPRDVRYTVHGHTILPHPMKLTRPPHTHYFLDLGGDLLPRGQFCVLDTETEVLHFLNGDTFPLARVPEMTEQP